MKEEIIFLGEKFSLNQCEDIWKWFKTSKVYEFTRYYDRVVFHAPNDYFYQAHRDDLTNYGRI